MDSQVTAPSGCQAIRNQGVVQIPDIATTTSLPTLTTETLATSREGNSERDSRADVAAA